MAGGPKSQEECASNGDSAVDSAFSDDHSPPKNKRPKISNGLQTKEENTEYTKASSPASQAQLIGSKRKIDELKIDQNCVFPKRTKSAEVPVCAPNSSAAVRGKDAQTYGMVSDDSITPMNSTSTRTWTADQNAHSPTTATLVDQSRKFAKDGVLGDSSLLEEIPFHMKTINPPKSMSDDILMPPPSSQVMPSGLHVKRNDTNFSTAKAEAETNSNHTTRAADFDRPQQSSHQDPTPDSSIMTSDLKSNFHLNDGIDTMLMSIDRCYRKVALYAILIWLLMAAASFYAGSRTGNLERLTGIEQKAPMVAATLLGASVVGSLMPFFMRRKAKVLSGVMVCATTVQIIALVTDLMLAFFPTPVFLDPVCGTRVYLLRWCEWTPLAFLMTFLAESCRLEENTNTGKLNSFFTAVKQNGTSENNTQSSEGDRMPKKSDVKGSSRQVTKEFLSPAYLLAWCQGLSTSVGILFPFCSGLISWTILLVISCFLYFAMFYRLHYRTISFRRMKKPKSVGEQEMYDWARLSLGLLRVCTALWTALVLAYFVYTIGPVLFPRNKFLNTAGLTMVCESSFDVLFKSIYLLIITDSHDTIFDQSLRVERRLEEMSQMMSAVWSNSSDIICISVKSASGDVTTMLSPTYLKMYKREENNSEGRPLNKSRAIAFDLGKERFLEIESRKGSPIAIAREFVPKHMYHVDFGSVLRDGESTPLDVLIKDEEIGSIAHLVVKAWNANKDETLLMHNLIRSKKNSEKVIFQCEAMITKMEKNAVLIVIRDISERFKRFEAEKKVVSESTARMKDAAANRFTRHEVKNGLLAAIGLCDSLRESTLLDNNNSAFQAHFVNKIEDLRKRGYLRNDEGAMVTGSRNMCRYLFELDKTLHEVLDTILADAMARDVIHEVYEPKLERVNLPKLLNSTMNLTSDSHNIKRFPITSTPNPLPCYAMDTQLLKNIHRNAISNACKYGKTGGEIRTEVKWDQDAGTLTMEVINLPGPCHEEILKLGDVASEIVFSPRRRLAIHSKTAGRTVSHSSGDGAWIMHKCAKTLGGSCDIKFEPSSTTFTFKCPVTPYSETLALANVSYEDFAMPKNIWGIALDDSKIQRKLLVRFFMYAGIPPERAHIKGATTKEIKEFDNWAVSFIEEHPDDYFLMIIDENLDIQEEEDATSQVTISGSLAISKMRSQLLLDQELRVLALIRSANDSASDVAIYNSRAHGFLPKAPIKKDSLREVLVPMLLNRFPPFRTYKKSPGIRAANEEMGAETVVTMMDLLPCINDIDTYGSLQENELGEKWNIIWEKLHALKGDLLIMPTQTRIGDAIKMISSLRGPLPPDNFQEHWQNIRSALLMVDTAI